jgi:hypothetical protein
MMRIGDCAGATAAACWWLEEIDCLTDNVEGGINAGLGDMFDYYGPMLLEADLRFDRATKPEDVMQAIDTAIAPLREKPVDAQLLARSKVKLRSSMYDEIGQFGGFGLVNLLASFALFDDDPAREYAR